MTARNGSTARQEDQHRPWNVREHLRPLEGWMLTDDAASYLGISREAVHRFIKRGTIRPKDARYLGQDEERRPIIVIRERAVREMPVSPQRAREHRIRAAQAAGLGDGLPEG